MIAPALSIAIAAAPPVLVGIGGLLAVGAIVAFLLTEVLAELVVEVLAEPLVVLRVELVAETLAEPLVESLVVLLAELADPGETKEPPETPPDGTLTVALPALSLNAARLLPPLGLVGCLSLLRRCV
jgi:hypothetical protein